MDGHKVFSQALAFTLGFAFIVLLSLFDCLLDQLTKFLYSVP